MGGFVSLGLADAVGIYQNWHYGSVDQAWNRIDFEMSHLGMRVDLLNTIREEIRDQVAVIISSLDNMMLVATLMITIGFGFAMESSSPPADEGDGAWEQALRCAYALLSASSLVCPFWALIFTLRLRYEVDICLGCHMEDLQQQLCNILQRKKIQAPRLGSQRRLQRSRSQRLRDQTLNLARNVGSTGPRFVDLLRKNMGGASLRQEMKVFEETAEIVTWAKEDLPQKLKCYDFYYPLVQLLLWLGMLSAVATCAVLSGLWWQHQYPNEPWMWEGYSFIVGTNCLLSMVFVGWMVASGMIAKSGARARSSRVPSPEELQQSDQQPLLGSASAAAADVRYPHYGSTASTASPVVSSGYQSATSLPTSDSFDEALQTVARPAPADLPSTRIRFDPADATVGA